MKLKDGETKITGNWASQDDGKVVADENCKRIDWLTESFLQQIKVDGDAWRALYKNPENGDFWILSYPKSHMHGGGPPELSKISEYEAKEEFGIP